MHRTAFLSIGLMLVSVVAAGSAVAQEGESKSVVNEGGPQLVAPENLQLREVPPVSYTHLTLPTNREV